MFIADKDLKHCQNISVWGRLAKLSFAYAILCKIL